VLTASLAAAISCHYFASFVFIALAIGEAVRTYSIRRLDLPVWIAFCLGATPLIAFWPLIGRSMGYSSGFWSKPNLMSLPLFYFLELNPVILPLMVMLVISAIYPVRGVIDSRKIPASIPRHEMAAALGFAAIPVFTVTLAILITGAFTDRYAITAIIGISIVTAFAIRNLLHNREAIVLILVISISIYFLLSGVRYYRKLSDDRSAHKQTESFLRAHCPEGMPIVISDSHAFTTLAHYASPDLADRIVYLADPEASLRYLGHNSVEKGMLDLIKPVFALNVQEYRSYIRREERFMVYTRPVHSLNWLLSELSRSDALVEMRGRDHDDIILSVQPKWKNAAHIETLK